MGKKIFVSYKYADNNVQNILEANMWYYCTARHYVDKLMEILEDDHIYKGESDGEDLSQLEQETIWEKLKKRIYDSSLTIVMISSGMREWNIPEKHQWIPREISYSLKEVPRIDKSGNSIKSRTNALMAIILPDRDGSYEYFVSNRTCCNSGCTSYKNTSSTIFTIMRKNMFNQKQPDKDVCNNQETVYHGDYNYMLCVKWEDFVNNPNTYIDKTYQIYENRENYIIHKEIE